MIGNAGDLQAGGESTAERDRWIMRLIGRHFASLLDVPVADAAAYTQPDRAYEPHPDRIVYFRAGPSYGLDDLHRAKCWPPINVPAKKCAFRPAFTHALLGPLDRGVMIAGEAYPPSPGSRPCAGSRFPCSPTGTPTV